LFAVQILKQVDEHAMRVAFFSLLSFTAAIASANQELTLSHDGRSDYVIAIPNQAAPFERTTARELREVAPYRRESISRRTAPTTRSSTPGKKGPWTPK
jgi:hypothetical protein